MEEGKSKDKDIYLIDIIKCISIIWKRKYWILGIVAIFFIASMFFTSPLFITPLYKSTVAFYPNNVLPKSDETPAKQLMFWCEANDIKDSIVKKYNYIERYGLSNDITSVSNKYDANIKVFLNKYYGNIVIEVLDKDPLIACEIANEIPILLNKKIENDIKVPYILNLKALKDAIDDKNAEIDSTIEKLVSFGIDYELVIQTAQGVEVTKGYLGTNEGSHIVNKEALMKMKKNIEERGPLAIATQQELYALISQRNDLQARYDAVNINVVKDYEFLSIVQKPYPSKIKAFPSSVKIAIIVSLFVFFITSLLFMFYDMKVGASNSSKNITASKKEKDENPV